MGQATVSGLPGQVGEQARTLRSWRFALRFRLARESGQLGSRSERDCAPVATPGRAGPRWLSAAEPRSVQVNPYTGLVAQEDGVRSKAARMLRAAAAEPGTFRVA